MNNLIIDPNDIINDTVNKLNGNECADIGNKNQWTRNCPKCGVEQIYKKQIYRDTAIFLNTRCKKCFHKQRTEERHTKENYVGKKFGKLIITNQYIGIHNMTMVNCKCECGNEREFELYRIKNGYIESCGCKRVESNQNTNSCFKRKPYGWSSFILIYNGYKANARHSRAGVREFVLSKDDAMKLFKDVCFYCGKPPSKIKKTPKNYGEFVYNGIDRKDNSKGYTLDNCVSCCEFCNFMKSDTPFDNFIEWIRKVNDYTKKIPCYVENKTNKKS